MLDVELASDIMLSLKEIFGEQGHSARQDTMRLILEAYPKYQNGSRKFSKRALS